MAIQYSSTRSDFYVYVLFRDTGVPFYVGKGMAGRWTSHEACVQKKTRSHKTAIIRDMQARGVNVPKTKIHEGLTEETAHEYEIALIAAIGRGRDGPLVNLTDGGEGVSGLERTPETRAKTSATMLGWKWSAESIEKSAATRRGKPLSVEHIAKIADAKRGTKSSPETRAKISKSHLGKKRTPEHIANQSAARRGKKFSPEARVNHSAGQRGKKMSPETKARMSAASFIREATRRAAKALLSPCHGPVGI